MRSRAFTLIELLVVVTIIAILAGLLLSALAAANEGQRSAKCIHNLQQISLGFQGYLQDHGNKLMQRFYPDKMDNYGYDEALLPYLGQSNPDGLKPNAFAQSIFTCASQNHINYPYQPGYGMNWYYDNQVVSIVERPAQTILVAETLGPEDEGGHRADPNNIQPGLIGRLDITRHHDAANYLFFDGHVSRHKFAETRVPIATDSDTNLPIDMWGKDYGVHSEPHP